VIVRGHADTMTMPPSRRVAAQSRIPTFSAVTLLVLACLLLATPLAKAQVTTFGSPLSVPATLNTAEGLNYPGTNTAVPPSPEAPNGYVHTYHFGADAALWNVQQAEGAPRAPATGQALKVSLEGCAVPAADGTPPLTQIHFQDLTPLPGGGAKINITSQAFDIPVCRAGGASGATVTTYNPINLCVSQGDYVAFNEEGGFVGHSYQSGVPYRVLGRVGGSSAASFIRGGGTNNGDSLRSSDTSAMDGYAASSGKELMMQITLGTHGDATHICPGGKQGLPAPLPAIRLNAETYGISHNSIVTVAVFCRVSPCDGVATLSTRGGPEYGHASFVAQKETTTHIRIPVKADLLRKIRAKHGVSATLSAVVDGQRFTQAVAVKILS
jgi:hypothetical protein